MAVFDHVWFRGNRLSLMLCEFTDLPGGICDLMRFVRVVADGGLPDLQWVGPTHWRCALDGIGAGGHWGCYVYAPVGGRWTKTILHAGFPARYEDGGVLRHVWDQDAVDFCGLVADALNRTTGLMVT